MLVVDDLETDESGDQRGDQQTPGNTRDDRADRENPLFDKRLFDA